MNQIKNIAFFALVLSSFFAHGQENTWVVPDDQRDKTAPALFNETMEKAGAEVYIKNCKSCHGDPGKNNVAQLNPLPPDMDSKLVSSETDGALHFKIANGKGLMPAFKNTLSNADVWNVISYIRTFHKNYVQPEPNEASVFGGSTIKLTLEYLANEQKFKVLALGKEKEKEIPAEGVDIVLFTKRYFGKLKLGEAKASNKDGIVFFDVPKNMPGNKEGILAIEARIVDTEKFGDASASGEYNAGVPTDKPSLTEKRAMWNVVSKAPWWITFAYPLAVLGVLATIFYIALLLKKIFIIGKESTKN
jgi:mono/diheme cytochrome c family protein